MRKYLFWLPLLMVLASCTEYSKVLKSRDIDYKFEYAKKAFDEGKYLQASTLLSEVYTPLRGTAKGEESLYLLARSYYENKDYINSNAYFKTYYTRYRASIPATDSISTPPILSSTSLTPSKRSKS